MQTMTICPRCSGKGSIPQFGHNYEGVCFQCRGLGKIKVARKDAHVPHKDASAIQCLFFADMNRARTMPGPDLWCIPQRARAKAIEEFLTVAAYWETRAHEVM